MDELVKNGLVFELGGGKDGLMYPATGTSPALVLDASGNGNNGVNSGAVLVDNDTALSFDGVDDRITANPIVTGSQYTLATWLNVKVFQSATTFGLIGRHIGVNNANWGIAQIGTQLRAYVGNSYVQWSGNTINVNKYIVVRFNRPNLEIFANNVLVASGTIDADVTSNALAFFIGAGGSGYQNCEISKTKIFNIAITDEQRTTLYNGGSVTDGLVLDLPMNRLNCRTNSGIDTAGNNTVTNYGATPCPDHNGRANRGWDFNGVDDYINIAYSNSLDFTTEFTFATFVRFDSLASSFQIIAGKYDATNSKRSFVLGANTNKLRMVLSQDGQLANIVSYESASTLVVNTWYHLAYVFKGATVKAFINANSITMNVTSGTPISSLFVSDVPTQLGSFAVGASSQNWYNGQLSKPQFINRALTASEIKKLYNYGRSH